MKERGSKKWKWKNNNIMLIQEKNQRDKVWMEWDM